MHVNPKGIIIVIIIDINLLMNDINEVLSAIITFEEGFLGSRLLDLLEFV